MRDAWGVSDPRGRSQDAGQGLTTLTTRISGPGQSMDSRKSQLPGGRVVAEGRVLLADVRQQVRLVRLRRAGRPGGKARGASERPGRLAGRAKGNVLGWLRNGNRGAEDRRGERPDRGRARRATGQHHATG